MTTLVRTTELPATLLEAGFSEAASRALGEWRDDPDWVRALRAHGWEAWEDIPMPGKTTEGWRRSDLRFLALDRVRPATALPERAAGFDALPRALTEQVDMSFAAGGVLVQRDGGTAYGEIVDDLREQGVIFTDLHTALREHRDLLEAHFMQLVPARWQPGPPSNAGKFEALNAAFFNGGSFVYVPPNTTVTLPVRSIFWASDPAAGFFPRSVVIVDRGARLVYLDEYRSVEAPEGAPAVFGSGVVELYIKDGARLDYVTTQEWSPSTGGFLTQRVTLGRDAYVNWVVVALGGLCSRLTADVLLQGKGTKADLLGLAFGERTQVFDIHTLQDHLSPYTDSDQLFKTALRDRARLAYEGLIYIRPGSYGSNGYQANKNLLLDDTAKADSIPMLQIHDNDVRCTHSSATGPVDEHHVHYLMTRGLPRPQAERMVIQGHFEPVIGRIAVEELKDTIRDAVDRRIGDR
ncbi:MAG: Fe-S cluster assembly protein SufD [Chloroflexi bacterium]|nr:Fe-S cluster assembly protein SufD [Chloroflexota bacterium]